MTVIRIKNKLHYHSACEKIIGCKTILGPRDVFKKHESSSLRKSLVDKKTVTAFGPATDD